MHRIPNIQILDKKPSLIKGIKRGFTKKNGPCKKHNIITQKVNSSYPARVNKVCQIRNKNASEIPSKVKERL